MIVNITILEGPLPDMTALIGQDIDVAMTSASAPPTIEAVR